MLLAYCGRLAVGGGGDHLLYQPFDIPAVFHEIHGQPVEQGGVRGQVALHPKIAGGFDNAFSEKLLPKNIDVHAGGEWVFFVKKPLG